MNYHNSSTPSVDETTGVAATLDVNMSLFDTPSPTMPEATIRHSTSYDDKTEERFLDEKKSNQFFPTFQPLDNNSSILSDKQQPPPTLETRDLSIAKNSPSHQGLYERSKQQTYGVSSTQVTRHGYPHALQEESRNEEMDSNQEDEKTDSSSWAQTIMSNPYSPLVDESSKWIRDLEKIRDDLQMISVKNAILLDSLSMVGEDFSE